MISMIRSLPVDSLPKVVHPKVIYTKAICLNQFASRPQGALPEASFSHSFKCLPVGKTLVSVSVAADWSLDLECW